MTSSGRSLSAAALVEAFRHRFGQAPDVLIRAPGRVNLIGEHTDYNDGFVLPMAIDRSLWIALRPRQDRRIVLHSLDFSQIGEFDLDGLQKGKDGWLEYVKGVAWALGQAGSRLGGWEGVMAGDVPVGAGLSSSAALEMAVARAFAAVSGFNWDPIEMAQIGQKAESRWVGVKCGIMDQMASAGGQADRALLIDCRSLETRLVPLPEGATVVILDTNTRRGLAESAYNERRRQCEEAAAGLGLPALRDISLAEFEGRSAELPPQLRRRAQHVISENERTLQAAEAMDRGSAGELGRLMTASHASLRDDFEVSSPALDTMVDCAMAHSACLGARMTGAGFGGCAVALVRHSEAVDFRQAVADCYRESSGREAVLYVTRAASGTEIVNRRS